VKEVKDIKKAQNLKTNIIRKELLKKEGEFGPAAKRAHF